MKLNKIILAFILSATACITTRAEVPANWASCNEKCQPLLDQAVILLTEGKLNEALKVFTSAHEADPAASSPLAGLASTFYRGSEVTKPELVEQYRKSAMGYAQQALKLAPENVVAQSVVRLITNGATQSPFSGISKPAQDLFDQAEVLFSKNDFKGARAKYQAAIELEPKFVVAMIYAADCDFSEKNYKQAEQGYRKALEVDPSNDQAWRFLAGTQMRLGYPDQEVEATLFNAIAAHPDYMAGWDFLEKLRKDQGQPLQVFQPRIQANLKNTKVAGKENTTIEIAPPGKQGAADADGAVWLSFGLAQASGGLESKSSAFKKELQAWQLTFLIHAESGKKALTDATLKQMLAFYEAKQLEPALFVFMYKEAWRADFEAWKKANPDGLRKFVNTFKLRPKQG